MYHLPKKHFEQLGQPFAKYGAKRLTKKPINNGQSKIVNDVLFPTNNPDIKLNIAPPAIIAIPLFLRTIAVLTSSIAFTYNAAIKGEQLVASSALDARFLMALLAV